MKMTRKKLFTIIFSFSGLFLSGFLFFLFRVLRFLTDPMSFSFMPIYIALGFLVLFVGSLFVAVNCMHWQPSVVTVEDEENWWEKWDRV